MNDRFYITGGTLPPDADSYVTRRADAELLDFLRRGEFCYVLNTRQVGKSSLMVRVAQQLRAEGVRVVLLDPTAIGVNVSVEEWYDGLLTMLAEQLGLRSQLEDFWLEHPRLGPLQRWMQALEHVALPHAPEPLCIFMDEIDSVRSLPFSADEFFGGIRECYNRRAQNPAFSRLTFCLLGVATPVDMIADPRITPFNIGRRIELTDFMPEEAATLGEGLNHGGHGEHGGGKGKKEKRGKESEGGAGRREWGNAVSLSSFVFPHSFAPPLDRILYWTGGHPYLTQRLCSALAQRKGRLTNAGVDAACEELFLSRQARKTDDNLAFVRSHLLYREADRAALLDIYRQVLNGQKIREDATNPLHSVLRLAGIVKVTDGTLTVRNRIYAQAFNKQWVRDNMPGEELRRQKAAYRRGLWRTVGLSSGVMAALSVLTLVALQQTRVARQKTEVALQKTGVALQKTEVANRKSEEASRSAIAAREQARLAAHNALDRDRARQAALQDAQKSEKQASLLAEALQNLKLADAKTRRSAQEARRSATAAHNSAQTARSAEKHAQASQQIATERLRRNYVNAGIGLLDQGDAGGALASFAAVMKLDQNDAERMRMHRLRFASACALAPRLEHVWFAGKPLRWGAVSPDRRWAAAGGEDGRAHIWNMQTGAELALDIRHDGAIGYAAFSPDGTRLVTCGADYRARVWDLPRRRLLCTLQHPRREDGRSEIVHASWSRDGKRLATGIFGQFTVWDVSAAGTSNAVDTAENGLRANEGAKIVLSHPMPGAGPNEAVLSPDGGEFAAICGNYLGWVIGIGGGHPTFGIGASGVGGCFCAMHGAFSADGRKLAVAGAFGGNGQSPGVTVLSAANGKTLCPLLRHQSLARYAAFSPDEKRVVTASDDRTARVWDAVTGKPLTTMLHESSVTRAEFSPDGSRVVTVSDDRTARVWDADTGRPLCAPLRHAGAVVAAHFSANPDQIFTVSRDGTARVWTLPPASLPSTQIADTGCGARLFANAGKLLISSVRPVISSVRPVPDKPNINRVYMVNMMDGTRAYPLDDADPMFTDALWSADGRRIAFCSNDSDTSQAGGKAQVWDVRRGRPITPVFPTGQALLSPDGRLLLLRDKDNQARMVDVDTGRAAWQCVNTIRVDAQFGFSLFAPDSSRVVVSDAQNRLRLLDARTGRAVSPPMPHDAPVTQVCFAPGGRYLFTWATSATTRIWNVADGSPACPPVHRDSFREGQSLAFTADGRWAVSATRCWKLDGSPTLVARELSAPFNGWSGSPDGSLIALQNKEDWLWDIETRASRTPALDRDVKLRRAAFSPDSRKALAIRADGAARLWDIHAGRALSSLLMDDQPIVCAAFSPDGKQIATGGDNGSVRLWDAQTGEALGPRLGMKGLVRQTEFLPNGRLFVSSNQEGRLWSLPNETETLAQMEARALLLSGQRIDANIGALPADMAALRAAWQRLSPRPQK